MSLIPPTAPQGVLGNEALRLLMAKGLSLSLVPFPPQDKEPGHLSDGRSALRPPQSQPKAVGSLLTLSLLQDSEMSCLVFTGQAKSSQKIENLMDMVKKLQKGHMSPL